MVVQDPGLIGLVVNVVAGLCSCAVLGAIAALLCDDRVVVPADTLQDRIVYDSVVDGLGLQDLAGLNAPSTRLLTITT